MAFRNGPPDLRFRFDPDAGSARLARRTIASLLRVDNRTAHAVILVASELVSNTVLHAQTGGEVRLWAASPATAVRLEVEDSSPVMPTARPSSPSSPNGRGIHLVASLADSWGVEPTAHGKRVWAEFGGG
jgi:anti-sigma regulatory factor (Ser/Thr protein kinase)